MAEIQITTDSSLIIRNACAFHSDCRIAVIRGIQVYTDTCNFVIKRPQMLFDCQLVVRNNIAQSIRTQLIIQRMFQQLISTTIRVIHLRRALLDTSFRVSGSQAFVADTAQHLEQQFNRSADAGLTIFNVIINEEHEIQT